MRLNKTILKAIPQKDFDLRSGADSMVRLPVDPIEIFSPHIDQFNKFAIGTHCWFIANTQQGIPHSAGGQMELMLPFSAHDFTGKSPEMLFKQTHPDDITAMFAFTNYWQSAYLNTSKQMRSYLRPTIYVRLLNPRKMYYWVMVQFLNHILSDDDRIIYALTFLTDVSSIKTSGVAMMSIYNAYDQTCQFFECIETNKVQLKEHEMPKISKREIEILKLISIGYSSKQVADELNISARTVDNHRQNLLRKTGCKSSSELTTFGIKSGLL